MRTLDNLFDNTQDLFNHICEHLISQGQKSTKRNMGCAYRGEDGMACAVGAVIPDEYYLADDEERGLLYILNRRKMPNWIHDNRWLLEDLQSIHDSYKPVDWKYRLREIAQYYRLNEPACIQR